MEREPSDKPEESAKVGIATYVLSGVSYIPLLGSFVGVFFTVWGLAAKRKGGAQVALVGGQNNASTDILGALDRA